MTKRNDIEAITDLVIQNQWSRDQAIEFMKMQYLKDIADTLGMIEGRLEHLADNANIQTATLGDIHERLRDINHNQQ